MLYNSATPKNELLYQIAPLESNSSHQKYTITKNQNVMPHIEEVLSHYAEIEQLEQDLSAHEKALEEKKCIADETLYDLQDALNKKKQQLEPYRQILQHWQPYGLLLKMAILNSPTAVTDAIKNPEDNIQDRAYEYHLKTVLKTLVGSNQINLLTAPHINDLEPVVSKQKKSFLASELCFIEQLVKRLRHLRGQLRYHIIDPRENDIAYIGKSVSNTILKRAKEALDAHNSAVVHAFFKIIDNATHGVCELQAIPIDANEELLQRTLLCLERNNAHTPLINTTEGWSSLDPDAALLCREIANKTANTAARQRLNQIANRYRFNRLCCKFVYPAMLLTTLVGSVALATEVNPLLGTPAALSASLLIIWRLFCRPD